MPGNAMPSRATRVLLPTTLLLSGLTYLAAFIAASVELDHARALNSLLCAPRRRTSTAPPPPGCRPYLLAAWAVAVPAAALSLLFVAVTTALLRRPRRPRRAALLAPALLLAGFWLAVLCVGWVPPRGAGGTDPAYFVPARDFAVAVSGAPDGPLTGGFAWAVRFYEYVFGGGSDLFLGAADAWEPMARAGLAGVILCTMALWVSPPLFALPGGRRRSC